MSSLTKTLSTGSAFMEFLVEVKSYAEFLKLVESMKAVEGVKVCERAFN